MVQTAAANGHGVDDPGNPDYTSEMQALTDAISDAHQAGAADTHYLALHDDLMSVSSDYQNGTSAAATGTDFNRVNDDCAAV
jgi:hypothetical protein